MANWVELKTFRTNELVWVNLDLAATITKGAAAFAAATKIAIPAQPDLYVSDSLEAVVAACRQDLA